MKKDFEQLSHTADLKIRVYGKTIKELFRNALIGMFQSIGPQAVGCETINGRLVCPSLPIKHEITVNSMNRDCLLVDFLSEAVYLSDVHNQAYLDATINHLDDHTINAILHGVKIDGFEVVEIKAVTYHDLEIKKVDDLWQVDIVFDI